MPKLKRKVIDVEVEVEFKRRAYNGKQKGDVKRFRLVATYNVEDGKYHFPANFKSTCGGSSFVGGDINADSVETCLLSGFFGKS